ncbi:hypothetical protein FB570_111288 [Streptomyces sp. T12]|nr:hypothetical protein FB570_111288 [Streptomyces sp. T12]
MLIAIRQLTMDNSAARSHPLDVSRLKCAGVSMIVTVFKYTIQHGGNRLQSPVRMPLEAR